MAKRKPPRKKRLKVVKKARKQRAPGSRAAAIQPINSVFKGLTLAVEPPIDGDPAKLAPALRTKLDAALAQLLAQGQPFKLVEGFRTTDRQQWLFGSGRPTAVPYGRPGSIVTNDDGVKVRSKHQGDGTPGTGKAADCYPLKDAHVYIPPSADPVWTAYASAVTQQGLVAGHDFPRLKDSPHCELP
jgi:hypothetical protein